MIARSLIGSILTLALLAGQTLVPLTRAACGLPRGADPPACSFCARTSASAGGATLIADRSCCAVQNAAAERDPARVSAPRAHDSKTEAVSSAAPACVSSATPLVTGTHLREAPPPLFDAPHRKTTVLLI